MNKQLCLLIVDLNHLLLHRCTVVFAADNANTYSDQVFRSLILDQNGAVLLEVVALARNERDALEEFGRHFSFRNGTRDQRQTDVRSGRPFRRSR